MFPSVFRAFEKWFLDVYLKSGFGSNPNWGFNEFISNMLCLQVDHKSKLKSGYTK